MRKHLKYQVIPGNTPIMYMIASRDIVVINAYGNESLSIVQRPL